LQSDNGDYVLVDSAGTTYQLDNQDWAKKFVGKKVKVSGVLNSSDNSIRVQDIQKV